MKPHFLRNVLCVSVAFSLLITSGQLPLRQAEAFVPVAIPAAGAAATANTATWVLVVNTLVMIGIVSSKADQKKCAETFPNNSKTQFCIPPKNGTLEVLIAHAVTYAHVVCPGLKQSCLQRLQNKATPFLRDLVNKFHKNPVAFKSLCPVFQTLIKMSIPEYCKANGYNVPDATDNDNGPIPPKKGGGGVKTGSMGQLPPFLQRITSWVSAAVQDALRRCPPWLKKLVPFCKEERFVPNFRKHSAEERARKASHIPFPRYTKIEYEKWEIFVREKFAEKTPGFDKKSVVPGANYVIEGLFYSNVYYIEGVLREIVLSLHNEIRNQLRKPKNKRNFTNYSVLAKLFVEYCVRAGSQYKKDEGDGDAWNKFSAPTKFEDYRYNEGTSEKFLRVLLRIKPKHNRENQELNAAIAFFTSELTTLVPQDELPLSPYPYITYPFFWRFIEPGDLDNKSKKRTNTEH